MTWGESRKDGKVRVPPYNPHFTQHCCLVKVIALKNRGPAAAQQIATVLNNHFRACAAGMHDFWGLSQSMDQRTQPFVRVYIDGVPCETHGCCSASIVIRPGKDSDADVLSHSLGWYTGEQLCILVMHYNCHLKGCTLSRLASLKVDFEEVAGCCCVGYLQKLPWQPQTILDAGANIGVATLALAHMYPMAQIVAVEPEPGQHLHIPNGDISRTPRSFVPCHTAP